ncbi:leucine--tRNA ligase [Patescibacteria group bacterium]|nr:leucine--tRNA ligase [Patescibacteria group bacterium]MBU1868146.1 leucine--tRNA ligase [Patescibacteria group bacterium]
MEKYNPSQIEPKWRKLWAETKLYQTDIKAAKNPYYNLWMFPYPSGARMHVGHAYASTGADIHGRFMRMNGREVFQPMGFDAFGIHGENYAIKVGRHPKELMDELCDRYRDEQFKRMGHGYDWSHEVRTYDADYYKWTQWIFLKLYKYGLAERKKASVNWCPSCKTVLADEQVLCGSCERCEAIVESKELKQWFFKITKYADHLLDNLQVINWPQKIKVMQINWIGRSEGAKINFPIFNSQFSNKKEFIEVFTTRPDTLFGATFFVLAPESEWVDKLTTNDRKREVGNYVRRAKSLTMQQRAQQKEKTGVFTGSYVVNPVSGEEIPVYVADYVLFEYGGGAVMGVPAHDQRDHEFARSFDLPVVEVISSDSSVSDQISQEVYAGEGTLINSGQFNGMNSVEARKKIMTMLEEKGCGKEDVQYKLRDWCISRQRYWGAPIPIIYCEKCGEVSVPEGELPVLLPDTEDWRPTGTEESPLAAIEGFVNTTCHQCGGSAKRETDVCDTFLDSAWYYYAYPAYAGQRIIANRERITTNKISLPVDEMEDYPFQPDILKKWLPVDMYVGGAEHAVLHLMYTRFLTMAFQDLGIIGFDEPFERFFAHGLITKDGAKMSKSKGNIVNPDEYIEKYGADAFRTYLMFLGPYGAGGDFTDSGLNGMVRFLRRVCEVVCGDVKAESLSKERLRLMHRTVKKVTEDVRDFSFNTAIAALMEWVKKSQKSEENRSVEDNTFSREEAEVMLKLLAPFAPHITEELWQLLNGSDVKQFTKHRSVHFQDWPVYDPAFIKAKEVTMVVQVNGKLRGKVEVLSGIDEGRAREYALQNESVRKFMQNKKVKRVIYVPDKLINFVV